MAYKLKEDEAAYQKVYRKLHKEERRKYVKDHREKLSKVELTRYTKRKIQLVAAHGGKCVICGYNVCAAALEFHHVIPNEKEGGIVKTFKEAEKCVLLCAICHKEHHSIGIRYR